MSGTSINQTSKYEGLLSFILCFFLRTLSNKNRQVNMSNVKLNIKTGTCHAGAFRHLSPELPCFAEARPQQKLGHPTVETAV